MQKISNLKQKEKKKAKKAMSCLNVSPVCRSMVGATIAMDSSVWATMGTSRPPAGSLLSKVSTLSR